MSAEKILSDWKKNSFKPVYWLEGEEAYFIDVLVDYAEKKLLSPAEAEFNLSVFYGKDADWAEVVNACKRYPMFGDKQVVILKEAQQMKDLEKLIGYIEQPLASTIFVVSHKEKKVDGRGKLAAALKKTKAEVLTTKKLYDNQLPDWAGQMIKNHGLTITPKALAMLVDHIGNDLSRIENEIEKLMLNMGTRKSIAEEDVENFIGVRPTVDGKKRVIEVNIFDFNRDIYGQKLIIRIEKFLRGEVKFNGLEELKAQLNADRNQAMEVFG